MVKAWHFAPANGRLHYSNEPIPADGETLRVDPNHIVPCCYGLHASTRPIDALSYIQTDQVIACRVELGGKILDHGNPVDKLCASERTILWRLSPETTDAVLRRFERWSALRVIDLWDAPTVVREYLETGNEDLRDAAKAAAGNAAWSATWASAGASARSSARAAANAAWDAANAAWNAARASAGASAGASARSSARAAAWDAAGNAARAAAWDAAWDAARDEQNAELVRLLNEAHEVEEAE